MLQDNLQPADLPFQIPQPVLEKLDVLFFKKGQLIFSEGSTPLGAFLLQKGKVKISKTASQGKEQIMRIVSQREFLSNSDLFTYSKYSTSAKALEDSYLLFISREEFWTLLRDQNYLFEKLLHQMCVDIKQVERKIADLAYKPVRGRLAEAILDLDKKFNTLNNGYHSVLITRADLAGYVGTVKETVNRLLSEFRKEHLISTTGTKINLIDLEGLNKICKMYN
ncbi:Crp/Fnr family transcriptional regulator [Antarcticibacterium arcticum]|uniref:Crp/Fnr family transcriptional regulator n=1 Tax=Antarcticibacterium arcticum TaxID=2585771 RepID=A0A5B8YGV6_9FLAO|nr:Crp/Fnr family transcriptional regulator [Antarcticibacterium arcticum]QED37222.1 Crp/Fnr family transcriptional regulator [Antarcticibacterium arcticum]